MKEKNKKPVKAKVKSSATKKAFDVSARPMKKVPDKGVLGRKQR